jgi:glycosyltransferase involved in cell wall biosynthesis
MKVSVIVPVYNEEERLVKCLRRLVVAKLGDFEIVAVDDGSTDRTPRMLQILADESHGRIRLVKHEKNGGKGMAIRSGIQAATGQIIAIFDADFEYDPKDLNRAVSLVRSRVFCVCYGSRFLKRGNKFLFLSYWANRILSLLTSLILRHWISDMETAIKVVRADVLKSIDLKENRFGIEPEITCKLRKAGYYIGEVPVSYNARTAEQGKKIKARDFFAALACLYKYGVNNG